MRAKEQKASSLGASIVRYCALILIGMFAASIFSGCTRNNNKAPEIIEEGETPNQGNNKKQNNKPGAPSSPNLPGDSSPPSAPSTPSTPSTPSAQGTPPPPTNPNSTNKRYVTYNSSAFGEYNLERVQSWVNAHRAANGPAAQNLRYTYIPFDLISDNKELNQARVGLWKAINHVSAIPQLYIGTDASEGHGLVWAIDISVLWGGNAQQKWSTVAGGVGKSRIFSLRQNERAFNATEPVSADRLVYNMLAPNIYNVLIETPPNERDFRRQIKAKNDKLWFAGHNEAIVFGPRVTWALETEDERIYWATGDEFDGIESKKKLDYLREGVDARPRFRRNVPGEHMLAIVSNPKSKTVASEAWIQKTNCKAEGANCFLNYYIWGNAGQERGRAETSFVLDPGNPFNRINRQGVTGGYLLTGRSCIHCHIRGAVAATSDMALAVENPNSGLSPEKIAQIREAWASSAELTQLYQRVNQGFAKSMRFIVMQISDADPAVNEEMIYGNGEEVAHKLLVRCDLRKCADTARGDNGGGGGLFGGLFGGG